MTTPSFSKPVVCAGEILVDLIAEPGETLATASRFAIREGGAPMNAAVALARLGTPARFCGVVGDDGFGQRLRRLLDREGVDATALRSIASEPTSIAYAWRDERGDGHFQLIRMADRMVSATDVALAGVENAASLLVGSVALAAEPSRSAITTAVSIARDAGVPVVFDINVRPTIWPDREALASACEPVLQAATVLKVSLDDAVHLWDAGTPETVMERCRAYPASLVVVTDGSRGVAVCDPQAGTIRRFAVEPVDAIDPTGAGDAFTAALINRLIACDWNTPADEDVRFAMAAGALATTRQGALTALPTLGELERHLAGQA